MHRALLGLVVTAALAVPASAQNLETSGFGASSAFRDIRFGSPPPELGPGRYLPTHRGRHSRHIRVADVIVGIHDQSRRTYGCRRIRADLADAYGQRVNKKLIRAIMAEQAISGLPRRRKGKPNLVHRATSADLVNWVFHRDGPRLNHFGHACS